MQRVRTIQPEDAEGRSRELLEAVETAFGAVPNAAKVMANSPAVLESFLAITGAMGGTRIGDRLHHQIQLAASEANGCSYCTSLLCATGPGAGLTAADLVEGRSGAARDPRTDAALKFATAVLETRGKVSDGDLGAVRKAGFGDAEVVEIVASVIAGCFTNFLNNVAGTALDFPEAEPLAGRAA